ncbi:PREDICTED: ethylene-responsive transcription factor ERF026-like [Nicotiana attenuata]|uniref:Ethylene-responsive transcription factor erf026 n=1 Tax=Nicotiana attenuata TaxID=49451 RepID=A0A1J6KQC7_NICAT|nr:PREDICTED: ethylene-responsive transcription factor ERF026-like [Nicotiana attenuata]OIT27048.1 ethylene-responsive transcription factor erf026 [Nicotiana attenuata]
METAAYDVAALALKGLDTPLNFPDSMCSYTMPASLTAADIRAAAEVGDEGAMGQEFFYEEEMFGMPRLLVDMVEAILMSPPRMKTTPYDELPEYSEASYTLWSYL